MAFLMALKNDVEKKVNDNTHKKILNKYLLVNIRALYNLYCFIDHDIERFFFLVRSFVATISKIISLKHLVDGFVFYYQ